MLNAPASQETTVSEKRRTALDAVRGIAAFIVILYHCYLTMPETARSQLELSLWSRSIRLATNGDASVIIFFVLSGYVLALPFFRGTQPSYLRYIFKRVCRIYIPFAVAICIAALLCRITDVHQSRPLASSWFNVSIWEWRWAGPSVLAPHFLMIGTIPDIALDGPMWSLVYEMRISVIFPLLIILCRDTQLALVVAASLFVASTNILSALGQSFPWRVENFWVTLLWTARIVPYFLTGILLSKHGDKIRLALHHVPHSLRLPLLVVPLGIFTIRHTYLDCGNDALYDIGAAMVIVLALDVPSIARILNRPVLQWLGRISYSL
jgi:peptidoglycan/LPS O-acetylase OafA/YrhL